MWLIIARALARACLMTTLGPKTVVSDCNCTVCSMLFLIAIALSPACSFNQAVRGYFATKKFEEASVRMLMHETASQTPAGSSI